MIINSFFKRNNTIISNSTLNTAKNPVVELFYGRNSSSRYIFTIDYMGIFDNFIKGDFVIEELSNIRHTLRMYNTSFFDYRLHSNKFLGKNRASSFDLVLYKLEDSFDEGVGYDGNTTQITHGKKVLSNTPSNSIFRENGVRWSENFAVDTSSILRFNYDKNGDYNIEFNKSLNESEEGEVYEKIINIQHFETGKENIEMDISDHVNAVLYAMNEYYLLGDMDQVNFIAENNNFCLAFTPDLERDTTNINESFVGFFSMYANSGYSPFIQSELIDLIDDDRTYFLANKLNRLYLYAKSGNEFKNLPYKPSVKIVKDPDLPLTDSKNLIIEFNHDKIVNPMKGVYYVEFQVNDSIVDECEVLYDIWDATFNDGDILNGDEGVIKPVEQSFSLVDDGFNSIGAFRNQETSQIVIFHRGINRDERINRGEKRKIFITPKIKFTSNQIDENCSLEYRLYAKEGINEIPFIDYSKLNKISGGDRFFYLDTNSFLPNTYFVDIKIVKNGNVFIEKEFFSFRIISSPVFSKQNRNKQYRPKIKTRPECDGDGGYVIDLTGE